MTRKTQSLILGIITIVCWGSLATFGNLLIHLPPFYVLGICFLMGALPSLINRKKFFLRPRLFCLGWVVILVITSFYFIRFALLQRLRPI